MLRKDAIYMLNEDVDSKPPVTDVIRKQIKNYRGSLYGSVRLATGRVLGSDAREIVLKKIKGEAQNK